MSNCTAPWGGLYYYKLLLNQNIWWWIPVVDYFPWYSVNSSTCAFQNWVRVKLSSPQKYKVRILKCDYCMWLHTLKENNLSNLEMQKKQNQIKLRTTSEAKWVHFLSAANLKGAAASFKYSLELLTDSVQTRRCSDCKSVCVKKPTCSSVSSWQATQLLSEADGSTDRAQKNCSNILINMRVHIHTHPHRIKSVNGCIKSDL